MIDDAEIESAVEASYESLRLRGRDVLAGLPWQGIPWKDLSDRGFAKVREVYLRAGRDLVKAVQERGLLNEHVENLNAEAADTLGFQSDKDLM